MDDHSKANDTLKQLAEQKSVELPNDLDEQHEQTVGKIPNLSGKEFDCEYMSDMVKDHEKDVPAFKQEAEKGKDADIKAFAAATVKMLEDHLQMAKDIRERVCAKRL